MPIFFAITIIFASLLGYGTYMKESYVEIPPSYAAIDAPTESIIETPLATSSSTENTETISPAPTVTLPVKTPQTTKPQKSDWTPPTTPSEITAIYTETKVGTSVTLSWSPSKDNIGVRGYRIFRDGNDLGTTNESYFADVEVISPTLHRYSILAFDSEGNNSPKSTGLTPSKGTLAVNTPTPIVPAPPTAEAPVATSPAPTAPPTTPAPAVTPAPTLTLSISPTSVTSGSSATLTWKATNATSCTASGAWSGAKATSGTQAQSNLTASKTYTLACTGGGGSVSKNATVTVAAAPAPTPTPAACGSGGVCTAADIAQHNTRANCWVYLSPINKAYNITGYVANGNNHPGGDVIVPYCGKNMYGPFISGTSGGKKHSNSALNSVLQAYYIGVFQ